MEVEEKINQHDVKGRRQGYWVKNYTFSSKSKWTESFWKDGKLHGPHKRWHADETIWEIHNYVNGELEGEGLVFYPDWSKDFLI